MIRRSHALAALTFALLPIASGCGASPDRPTGHDGAGTTPVPHVVSGDVMVARAEPAPPRRAAATLAVPAGLVDAWLVAIAPSLPPMVPHVLDELLGPNGSRILAAPSPLRELGIDTAGTGLLLLGAADAAQEPLVQRLRGIATAVAAGQTPTEGDFASLDAIRRAAGPTVVRVRAVIPTVDPDTLLRIVRTVSRESRTDRDRLPETPSLDLAWAIDGEIGVGIWHDSSSFTIDVWLPLERRSDDVRARALAALVQARNETIVPDPTTTTGAGPAFARLAMDPAAIARLAALHGDAMVQSAVANVSPEHRSQILATGIAESCRSFDLTETPRGPLYRAVGAHARSGPGGLEGEITAELGPGFPQDPTLWRPSASLDFAGLPFGGDVDLRWLRGFQFPAGGASHERTVRLIEEAGFWGYFVALPLGSLVAASEAAEEAADRLPLPAFERAGAFMPDMAERSRVVAFGILPPAASRAQAACALTPAGTPCRARLALGRTVAAGDRFARLESVDGRLVVFVSRERADLDRVPRHLAPAPVAPARVEVTDEALRAEEPTLAAMAPGRTLFEITSDGATLRTRARTVARP